MAVDYEPLQTASAGARARLRDRYSEVWWSLLIRGLLATALGLAALIWPSATLALLVTLIGLYVLFDGIFSLIGSFRARVLGAYLVPGLISVAIGLVLLFWPGVTARFLMVIVGVWALFQGVVLFMAGRQGDPTDPDRGLTITIGVAAAVIGIVLIIWPGTGVVTISWIIALAALVIGGLLLSLALRLRRAEKSVASMHREME